MKEDPFKDYKEEKVYTKEEKSYSWSTAIGLQKVDGLDTSKYLNDLALKNINENLDIKDIKELIKSYYEESNLVDKETEEADKVAINIAEILLEKSFVFSVAYFLDIHKRIFNGVFEHAGLIRPFNITKKEWVLNGDTVVYGEASLLKEALEYDFNKEKNFDYSLLDRTSFIPHIARFIADLWQIHPFREGNTRCTAVFLIKYLRTFGFNINNDLFKENSWYFRNALVRANYSSYALGIYQTTSYLELFLDNLLNNTNHELKNRIMHINYSNELILNEDKLSSYNTSRITKNHITLLYNNLSNKEYFGRTDVINVLSLSDRGASKLIKKLLDEGFIIPIKGFGKGKYKFNIKITGEK